MAFKIKLFSIYDYREPKNGTETKSDIFFMEHIRSDVITFLSKNIKVFQ